MNYKKYIECEITNGTVLIDEEDYELICFHRWHVKQNKSGNKYATTTINGRKVRMHRLIFNPPDEYDIDHINRNGLDNRKENLRIATRSQNIMNSIPNRNTSSKYKGVTKHKLTGRWQSAIQKDGITLYLGLYDYEDQAACAYDLKAKELFGQYALFNFPEWEVLL